MLPTRTAASRLVIASLSVASLLACGMEPSEAAPSERLARAAAALTSAVPISPERELVITHPGVIASALETAFDPASPSGTSARGAWSFGRLVHNMLPPGKRDSAAAASALVMSWLRTWESEQLMNGEVSAARARPAIRLLLTDRWKAASGCSDPASPATDASCVLDMSKAPFKLLAILYRPDLRVVASDGTAIGGEGRFVFQVVGPTLAVSAVARQVEIMDPTPRPQKFTVIVEYSLPVARNGEILTRWAYRWHALGAIPFGETYNAALLDITNDFAGPDRDRRRPNGNALNQLRTNEVALAGARFVEPDSGFVAARQVWELREFRLTPSGLAPHTVALEPSRDFDLWRPGHEGSEGTRSQVLARFLLENADAVLGSTHNVTRKLAGNSALVGSAPYGTWARVVDPDGAVRYPESGGVSLPAAVRNAFALDTCAGCHRHETDTRHFMHVTAVAAMEPASKVDDRARIGVGPETPEDATVLSNFLAAEVSPGGGRFEDYAWLLSASIAELVNKKGLRACR